MASSWITIPHLRPSSDTTSPQSHPGVLAQERVGPFAVSAAQIRVKIGEDGQHSLPSNAVLDKRYTHSAPTVVTLQVKNVPAAPSDVHTNVPTTSPLPKHKQVARPQPPSSSSTFERQVLASIPTTNSQPVAPISAASNLTPPLPPNSFDPRPVSTTDISAAGSPTIGYSINQSLNQSPNLDRGQPARPTKGRSGTMRTYATSGGGSTIAQTEYTEMLFASIPFRYNVLTCFCNWIILAGFLVLPSSFPNIQTIVNESNKLGKVGRVIGVARNVPVLVIGFSCCGIGAIGLCYLWWRFKNNYFWLLGSIFIPGLFAGLSGLISTFVNLYGSGNGVHYGTTTIATIAAIGGYAAICGFLTMIYTIKRHLLKRHHDRETEKCNSGGEKDKLESQ